MKNKIVYIAHPIGGDVEANLADLRRILRIINLNEHPDKMVISVPSFNFAGITPICSYYADVVSLDDSIVFHRKKGIENDEMLIKTGVFNECWLTGSRLSLGMADEILLFRSLGTPIIDYLNKI